MFSDEPARGIADHIARAAKRKLDLLDAAKHVDDVRSPPGNRLERLRGDRAGQWPIRVNDQWRICFRWESGHAYGVQLVDYHEETVRVSIPIEDVRAGKVDLGDVIDPDRPRPDPVTPGEILLEEFMRPLDLSVRALAAALGVPPNRISQIVRGERAITASTALRLARYFGTSPELWLGLQTNFDLRRASTQEGEAIRRTVHPRTEAAA